MVLTQSAPVLQTACCEQRDEKTGEANEEMLVVIATADAYYCI
jgi:hypothetical protein